MLQGCQNQCLEGFLMKIHENTMRLAGTRSEHPEKALFLNKTGWKKGKKVIFKNFQHPMLWGVYPEVLMALAQNSWQIWNSSNRLGDKSLHLFLKEPVRKRLQSCWAIDPYGWPSKKNCTTISGMLGGIFWPMRLAGTRSEHPEKVLFLSDIGQKRVKKWC